jgi:hypothetical protein
MATRFEIRSELYHRAPKDEYEAESLNYGNRYIEDLAFYLIASEPSGRQFGHHHMFASEEEAREQLEHIEQVVILCPKLMENYAEEYWTELDPVYGSEAYQARESQLVRDARRREVEAEFGAGSYQPGCPGFIG